MPALPGPHRFVYPIIDGTLCEARGYDPLVLAAACLAGGARLLQLRCKDHGSGRFLALAERLVRLAAGSGGRIVINDRPDIARLSGAAGVHVGQDDLPAAAARAIVGPGAIVGVSTHDEAQVDAALAGDASYVAVGPIFTTATKDTGYDARGLGLVRYAARRGTPIVAIGGITVARAAATAAAGADGLAVITDLFESPGPEERVRQFLAAIA